MPDISSGYNFGVHWIWRGLSVHWPVLPQPDRSGAGGVRLGMAQLPTATSAEKDQYHSLPAHAGACSNERGAVGDGGDGHVTVDFGAELVGVHCGSPDSSGSAHSQDGDSLRQRIANEMEVTMSDHNKSEIG